MKKIWLIGLFLITILSINSFLFAQEETATFSKELTSESLYEEGIKLCEQKKYKEAISYFEEATKRKANFAEAYYQIGFCYLKTRDFEKAKQSLIFARILSNDDSLKKKVALLIETIPEEIEKEKQRVEREKEEVEKKEKIAKIVKKLFVPKQKHPLATQALVSRRALESFTADVLSGNMPPDEAEEAVSTLYEMGPSIWPLTMELFIETAQKLYSDTQQAKGELLSDPMTQDVIRAAIKNYIQYLLDRKIILNAQFIKEGAPIGLKGGMGFMGTGYPGFIYVWEYFSKAGFLTKKEVVIVYRGISEDEKHFSISYYIPDLITSSPLQIQQQIIKNNFTGIPIPQNLIPSVKKYNEKKKEEEAISGAIKTGVENMYELAERLVEEYPEGIYELVLNSDLNIEVRIIPLINFIWFGSTRPLHETYELIDKNYQEFLNILSSPLPSDFERIFECFALSDRIRAAKERLRKCYNIR